VVAALATLTKLLLHWIHLVLRWMTIYGYTVMVCKQPLRPTQPPALRGTGNEYQSRAILLCGWEGRASNWQCITDCVDSVACERNIAGTLSCNLKVFLLSSYYRHYHTWLDIYEHIIFANLTSSHIAPCVVQALELVGYKQITYVLHSTNVLCYILSSAVHILFTAVALVAFAVTRWVGVSFTHCQTMYVLCSPTMKTGSLISAAATNDSSPQSLGSGSDRMASIRPDSDRRSAMSSLDDMDACYPSRLVWQLRFILVLLPSPLLVFSRPL